jgi:hypothetical protein
MNGSQGTRNMISLPVNLQSKFALFSEHLSTKIIFQMYDYHFKLVKNQGDFVWHSHPASTDAKSLSSSMAVWIFPLGMAK